MADEGANEEHTSSRRSRRAAAHSYVGDDEEIGRGTGHVGISLGQTCAPGTSEASLGNRSLSFQWAVVRLPAARAAQQLTLMLVTMKRLVLL
jgi:hypothetical protein